MRIGWLAATIVSAASVSWGGAASQVATAKPPGQRADLSSTTRSLPAGTVVYVEIAEPVSSRSAKTGGTFRLRLVNPLIIDGQVVVPNGAEGVGQVVDAAKAGLLGKPAKLVLAARYLQTSSGRIGLRGLQLGRAGTDNSNVVLAASFVPYAGLASFLIKGGEVEIPAGALARAKLAAELTTPSKTSSIQSPVEGSSE